MCTFAILSKNGTVVGAASEPSTTAAPRVAISRHKADRTVKLTFAIFALVTFGLIASLTPAAALRSCSRVEIDDISDSGYNKCVDAGGLVQCEAETGKAYCCIDYGGYTKCGIITDRVTINPPGPKPGVKFDIPPVRSVSPPPKSPRLPRVDPPPRSVAPSKPPAGPIVR